MIGLFPDLPVWMGLLELRIFLLRHGTTSLEVSPTNKLPLRLKGTDAGRLPPIPES